MPDPSVAIVLPPREGFGPNRVGAIGMLGRRYARVPGFQARVYGGVQDGPIFPNVDFRPIKPTIFRLGPTNVRYAVSVANALRDDPVDIVEVHNRPEIARAIADRLPKTPVILILNNDPREMRDAQTPAERAALLGKLAAILTSSAWLRDRYLEGIDRPARQISVLPNCLDLTELPPPRARERMVLFAGRVVAEKGPDAFVTACAAALPHLPAWRAMVIGADRFRPDSPETAFAMQIRAAAAHARVDIAGYRDHPEVLEAMAKAAIVVVPSRWPEPFGLVAVEAMASGAALICSPRGGLPEVGGDVAVYADPDDPAAIATAIRTLAKDEVRRAELAVAGRERAKLFDLPVVADMLAQHRRRLLA